MPLHGRSGLRQALGRVRDDVNNTITAAYIYGLGEIIQATPVHFKDGGRLKNNWLLSVGWPTLGTTVSANSTGASSYAQLSRIPADVLGKKIYFVNNLDYAAVVEYGGYPNSVEKGTYTGNGNYQKLSSGGYSRQAPNGMARVGIRKIQSRLN